MPSHSLKVAWKEDDVLKNRDFDYSKRFLPNQLAGVDEIACLDEDEKRKLNQVIGNASCHIFVFVEEFIVPQTLQEAQRDVYREEARLRALLRFAEEEIKHQQMFRRSMATFDKGFGIVCGVIPGREDVARIVRLELAGAIDGLLAQQADLDIESLQRTTRRTFADRERAEIKTSIQRGYRWTFLVSGLTHPTFARIVGELTEQGPRRIAAAAEALSA